MEQEHSLPTLYDLAEKEELQDLKIAGFLYDDEEGILEFSPRYWDVYLEFESKFICLSFTHTEAFEMSVHPVEKSEFMKSICDFDEEEDDYRSSFTSFSGLFVPIHVKHNRISKIELYSRSEETYNDSVIDCIGIAFGHNSYLFLDSLSFDGINIGKKEQRDAYFEYIRDRKEKDERYREHAAQVYKCFERDKDGKWMETSHSEQV